MVRLVRMNIQSRVTISRVFARLGQPVGPKGEKATAVFFVVAGLFLLWVYDGFIYVERLLSCCGH